MTTKTAAMIHVEQQDAIGYCRMILSSRAYGLAHNCPRFVSWADDYEPAAIWRLASVLKMPMLNRAGHRLALAGGQLRIVDTNVGAVLWHE